MTSLFDKLNLRPGERRLVVIAGGVVFVFLNLLLVFPHFGDLGRVQQQLKDAGGTLQTFQMAIAQEPEYAKKRETLGKLGAEVAEAGRALQLQRDVSSQALLCGVPVQSYDKPRTQSSAKTNAFFDEEVLNIRVNAGEKELVCFLNNLAEKSSLIRVLSMSLQPDARRYKLQGNITLVASYQKEAPRGAGIGSPPAPVKKAAPPAPSNSSRPASAPARPAPARSRPTSPVPAKRSTPAKPVVAPKQPTPSKPPTLPPRMNSVPVRSGSPPSPASGASRK